MAMGWRKPDNVAGSSAPAIMVGSFVATGGLLFGYDTGTINGVIAMQSFLDQYHTAVDKDNQPTLTPSETAIIVAILSAGTFAGALIAAPIADWIGRRLSLIVSVAIFCFGVIFQVCSDAIPLLLAGRYACPTRIPSLFPQTDLSTIGSLQALALARSRYRSLYISRKWLPSGSEAPSSALISSQ